MLPEGSSDSEISELAYVIYKPNFKKLHEKQNIVYIFFQIIH